LTRQTLSALFLIAVNTVPLVGVLIFDWSLFSIVFLYWIENGIVGFFNVLKIAWARKPVSFESRFTINGRPAGRASKLFIIPFFIFHYGMFWVVHGVFVFLLPLFAGLSTMAPGASGQGPMDFGPLPLEGLGLSALGLAASHGISFFVNYLGRGEYLHVSPEQQMMSVYGRVFVLHITILGGAFVVGFFGTPFAALVLLVGLKTAIDLFFHLREHQRAEVIAA
jgi:hypothetical protein